MTDDEPRKVRNPQVDRDFTDLFLKSPLGPKVLGKMMDDVDFFDVAVDLPTQRAQDEIKIILTKAGIGAGLKGQNVIRALAGTKGKKALISDEESHGGDE